VTSLHSIRLSWRPGLECVGVSVVAVVGALFAGFSVSRIGM
jgi:hypothetical protein